MIFSKSYSLHSLYDDVFKFFWGGVMGELKEYSLFKNNPIYLSHGGVETVSRFQNMTLRTKVLSILVPRGGRGES